MKLAFKNRFFVKMLLTYCLIIFLGLGLTSYLVTSDIVTLLAEKESAIEREVITQVKNASNHNYNTINAIFASLYMKQPYNNNISIVDFIDPGRASHVNEGSKQAVISSYLHDICSANAFFSDFFIIDYYKNEVFFQSNVPSRDVSLDYDFYRKDFLGINQIDNTTKIIPNHIPEYLNAASVNNFPVISFCIYLFSTNAIKFDEPIGMAVINVRADFFKAAYRDSAAIKGNIYVINEDNLTLFDSLGVHMGKPFPFNEYEANNLNDFISNDRYIVNKLSSDRTGFSYIGVVDRKLIDAEDARN
jgi:hypothetical protein